MWGLAWDAHALVSGTPLFDSNIYHPEPGSLRFNEHFLGIALAALPFQWIGGPVFAYWVVWLLSFPLNALAMYVLAWHTTRDRAAAFVAGLIYAFCFFRMHHAHGHLQLLWTWPLPLLPLAIHRWIELPSWGRALCVAALVVMQALASWYLAVLTAIVCLVSAAVCGFGRTLTRRHVVQGGLAAVVGGGFVVWLALPYLSLQPGGAGEAAGLSADLTGYLLPPLNTWVGQRLPTEWEPREIWGERTIYVGMTTLLLATIGLGKWGRSSFKEDTRAASGEASSLNDLRPHLAVLITGVFAFAVSFGPSTGGWSPYDLLSQLPGFSLLRAPARLARRGDDPAAARAMAYRCMRSAECGHPVRVVRGELPRRQTTALSDPTGVRIPRDTAGRSGLVASCLSRDARGLSRFRLPVLLDGALAADRQRIRPAGTAAARRVDGNGDALSGRSRP
jgi:hypothetical protein